jgi:16S rRNA (guanine527-N7)-methyltransferase
LGFASLHLTQTGIGMFPRGQAALTDLAAAQKDWKFDYSVHASLTDPEAKILRIENITHV